MAVPPELHPSKSDVGSLIAIGIYIVIIGVMWNAPVLKSILYPFKASSASLKHSLHGLHPFQRRSHPQ